MLFLKNKQMEKKLEKIRTNTQRNFLASKEITYWSKKYNTSIAEIQQIFETTGSSISKTLDALRKKEWPH